MKKVLFLLYVLAVTSVNAQSWLQKFPVFYQQVNAIAQYGDTLFVGGRFNNVGPNEGMTTIIDSATGNANTTFPRMYNYSKLVADGNGGMYVVGNASIQIGGQFRSRLAHVYANGVLSTWNPSPNGIIKELKVYGDKVYVAGSFDTIAGQRRRYMAALDTGTGAATSWNPNIDQPITTFAVTNNSVYVAGQFTFIAGQVRGVLAAFNATTGAITSWDPSAGTVFTATNPGVTRLEAVGNTIYAGGSFTSIGGQARNNIAAIDATTGMVTPWTINVASSGNTVISDNWVISGNTMYIMGDFTSVGGQPRNKLASVDLTTGLPTSWNPNVNNSIIIIDISSFSISGNTLYISYSFPRNYNSFIIAINAVTGALLPWSPQFLYNGYPPLGAVSYSTIIAGKIFAYGYFYSVNVQTTPPLVAISATRGNVLNLNYNVHGTVSKLVTVGSKLYIIGSFDSVQGQSRKNLAAINIANGSVTPWNPNPNNTVLDLVVNAGTVYLSGAFTSIGGQVRNYLAAVDTSVGSANSWAPVVNATNSVLTASSNKLYVGGTFTTIGGQARNRLASFDLSTGALTAWNPNPINSSYPNNTIIIGLAKNDSSLFVLGYYTSISNQSRNELAAFDLVTDTLKLVSFNLLSPLFPFAGLVANNNKVYVFGGTLSNSITPAADAYFVSMDARTGQNIPWKYPISGGYPNNGLAGTTACGVYATHLYGDNVYAGGIFLKAGTYTSASFAVFGDSTAPVLPPVSFINFQGQRLVNDTIQLNWQTANENYISGYEVQRSNDSSNFTTVGTVTLNSNHSYQFLNKTTDSVTYYRIKTIPVNGTTRYTNVIKFVKPPLPPIRFISFQGQRQASGTVQLNWQTADENYVSGYEVQRSTDSINFTPRGIVSLNSAFTYQFTDQTTDTLNFYRIRAIPTNVNTRYSGIIKLSVQQPQQTVYGRAAVYPNPSAGNQLQLHLDSLPTGNYHAVIYNFSGNRVMQQNITHAGRAFNQSINVSRLIGGIYIVTLTDDNGNAVIRERWMKL